MACIMAKSMSEWKGKKQFVQNLIPVLVFSFDSSLSYLSLFILLCVNIKTIVWVTFPRSMINADFCTGAVLISFGAVLGKTSPVQMLIMAIFEVTLFAVNEFILLSVLEVSQL